MPNLPRGSALDETLRLFVNLSDHEKRQLKIDALSVSEDEKDRLYQQTGAKAFSAYDANMYRWGQAPPDDAHCRACYTWARYPVGQRHFGYAWWRTCDWSCPCAHHKDEVWLA